MKQTGNRLLDAAYNDAVNRALKAKLFKIEHDGHLYTGVFNQDHWVYDVYQDGFFMQSFNFKDDKACKKYLINWLNS